MAKLILIVSCFSLLQHQVLSQLLTRQIEQPRTIIPQLQSPYPLVDSPYNTFIPNVAAPSSTTIITDCSPTACKNLANTLQLMIVANLLQNTNGGSEKALQIAAPILNELLGSPTLSCGCANPLASLAPSFPPAFSPSLGAPSLGAPSLVSPNIYSLLNNPNLVASLAGGIPGGQSLLNFI